MAAQQAAGAEGVLQIEQRDVILSSASVQIHFPFLYEATNGVWYMTYRTGPHGQPSETAWARMSADQGGSWSNWPGLVFEDNRVRLFRTQLNDGAMICTIMNMTAFARLRQRCRVDHGHQRSPAPFLPAECGVGRLRDPSPRGEAEPVGCRVADPTYAMRLPSWERPLTKARRTVRGKIARVPLLKSVCPFQAKMASCAALAKRVWEV